MDLRLLVVWLALGAHVLVGCQSDVTHRSAAPTPSGSSQAGTAAAPSVTPTTVSSHGPEPVSEAEVIVKTIEQAMRAGLQRHDLGAYMSLWADDATLVVARRETKGRYDLSLTRAQIEASRKVRFSVPPVTNFAIEFADADVKVEGDQATMTWLVATDVGGVDAKIAEHYELRKTATGWKVTLNRYWPVQHSRQGETTRYDTASWKRLDDAVAAAKQAGNGRKVLAALIAAWRFAEAHAQAKKVTAQPDATAADWQTRSAMAVQVGDGKDAAAARAKAVQP